MDRIAEFFGKAPTHLVAAEIGGANAFIPLIAGSLLGLPVVDADSLGRAFPELQMSSCHLNGISPTPAFLSDAMGRVSVATHSDACQMEADCREICMHMGSSAAVAVYLMDGEKAKKSLIEGTASQAIELGAKLKEEGVQGICQSFGGKVLGSGIIVDISQAVCGGFLKGSFSIQCGKDLIIVEYQNEFLAAFREGRMLAATPEIIIPLEEETAMPITSESLQYGLRVNLLELPAPSIWKTGEGLKLVGIEQFNIRSYS